MKIIPVPKIIDDKSISLSLIYDITQRTNLEQRQEYLSATYIITLLGAGGLLLMVSSFLFISLNKLKKKNQELLNFDELRKAFIDASDSATFLKDEKHRFVFVNEPFLKYNQTTEADVIGYSDYDILNKEKADLYHQLDLEVLESHKLIINTSEETNKVYQTIKFPVKMLNGRFGVGAYVRDITEEYRNKTNLVAMNQSLKENKEKLQLILDSTAEAIFGIDLEGICTFCNASCLKILKFQHYNDLEGKKIHDLIHHSKENGHLLSKEECKVNLALINGEGVHAEDEVFWRSDGTSFDVAYYSYPQFLDGKLVGAVVTFLDITERKNAEKNKLYLSYHDYLTGLYNRQFMEDELKRIDSSDNLPISIIIADVNGLKFTNDVFGHNAGDELLKSFANILKDVCKDFITVRTGGDEFAIILPQRNEDFARNIIEQISLCISDQKMNQSVLSVAFGVKEKTKENEDIHQIYNHADNIMYSQKVKMKKDFEDNILNYVIKTLFTLNPLEEKHCHNVSELCYQMGLKLNLTKNEIEELKLAGLFHAIGNINNNDNNKKSHPEIGYRILRYLENYENIASYVLYQHERVDGCGYPKGLKNEEIPIQSKVISIVDSYDKMITKGGFSKEEAIEYLKDNINTIFDSTLARLFLCDIINEQWD